MRALIVEDEKLAADYLIRLLSKVSIEIQIVERVDSVKNAIQWLSSNAHPDLIFMDVDLGDGLCFEIFERIEIQSAIIFTTAFDEFAIQAFKVNSVDYLLKPINHNDLEMALTKYAKLSDQLISESQTAIQLASDMVLTRYKKRFVIKIGDHLKTIAVDNIRYFKSREKATFAYGDDNRNYLIDYTMDQVEQMMDPTLFFRVNRKYILNIESIRDIIVYSNSRLKVSLQPQTDEDVIVSRERVSNFKNWLDK